MASFLKYICSFFARNFVIGFMLQCFVCTHFVITPFSEVRICREVFNCSEFHSDEDFYLSNWYFSLVLESTQFVLVTLE